MSKTQTVIGHFVEPIPTRKKLPLEKEFNLALRVPEIKNYQEILLQTDKRNVSPNTSRLLKDDDDGNDNYQQHQQQRIRSKSSIIRPTTTPKSKLRKRKSSHFLKLSTLNRPDILYAYLSYSDIVQYLDYIKLRFPNFTRIHTLGLSFERRPIKCIEINWQAPSHNMELKELEDDSNERKIKRNIIFIEGGTHGREWISITVALNCIYQLTERNVRHRDLLRNLIFYIVPVINPDGYEYTRNVNPRWRKNRRPQINGDNVGTDCNRNFDFHWNESCSKAKRNTYQGDKPFSEPETKALATILHSLAPKLLFYLSLHSYAQSIMYPWGYTNKETKYAKLMESVAIAGRNAIKALTGRYYRVGSIARITKRYIAGSVIDYAHGAVKIPLTLVMELPSNEYGFQPPSDKIHPLGMESWHGIREMCNKAYSLKKQIEEMQIQEEVENKEKQKEQAEESGKTTTILRANENKIEWNRKPLLNSNEIFTSMEFKSAKQRISDGIITSILDVK